MLVKTYGQLKNKLICRFCKRTDVPLMKNLRTKYGQYYACRSCNTENSKKYRSSKNGMKKTREAVYKSIQKYPHKQNARQKLQYAVKKGYIQKPDQCICGNIKVEAHHTDYSKPLVVTWLCRACHANEHKKEICHLGK